MVHGDQKGLVLPPKVAPIQLVIIPIFKKDTEKETVLNIARGIAQSLQETVRVHLDDRDYETPGAKFYEWELKGVPLRLEIGPRDIAAKQVVIADRLGLAKETVPFDQVVDVVHKKLELIHNEMFKKAQERMQAMWHKKAKLVEFKDDLEHQGGFYQTGWCGAAACEQELKEYKATIRCLLPESLFDSCFFCDKASSSDVLVAKAY